MDDTVALSEKVESEPLDFAPLALAPLASSSFGAGRRMSAVGRHHQDRQLVTVPLRVLDAPSDFLLVRNDDLKLRRPCYAIQVVVSEVSAGRGQTGRLGEKLRSLGIRHPGGE